MRLCCELRNIEVYNGKVCKKLQKRMKSNEFVNYKLGFKMKRKK